MTLRQLSLTDFRNLKPSTLDVHERFNLITGCNGSGKTNLLDAINIVCQGKSFKTYRLDRCIQHQKDSFLLFARYDHYKAGISRSSRVTTIRIDNENVNKLSQLAEKTPVRIINTNSFELVNGQPGYKREFLNWCLFHVEPDYKNIWLDYTHALKQRNALLKIKKDIKELDYWDEYLSRLCLSIRQFRLNCFKDVNNIIVNRLNQIIGGFDIEFYYQSGWDTDKDILLLYQQNRLTDLKLGYTRLGIHRDDIKIYTKNKLVQHVLSRGQMKRLSIAMIIAKVLYVKENTEKNVILLIDDINSEMDRKSVDIILKILSNYNIQLFVTSIDRQGHLLNYSKEYKMFHVEHGIIKSVKNV